MPSRKSTIIAAETATLRRSPRFFTHKAPPLQLQIPTTRRSLRFLQNNDSSAPKVPEFRYIQSTNLQVHHSDAYLRSSQNAPLKNTKRSSKHGGVPIKNEDSNTGSGKASALENGFEGVRIRRRSSRLSYVQKVDNELVDCNANELKKSGTFKGRSRDFKNPNPGVRRSTRLNNGIGEHQCIGSSRNFWSQQCALDKNSRDPEKFRSSDTGVSSGRKTVVKGEKKTENSSIAEANSAKGGEGHVVDGDAKKKPVVRRKRKRDDDDIGIKQGWTKEQEVALQNAYYAAKPTPQFWKKVSKLVPGKSAQDCFDKVHSDHLTPPQPRSRSRTQGIRSSHIELLSLAEGKLLNPDYENARKPSRNKQKSQVAQKAVRYLLQKSYQGAQNYEADFFSLLEPNINQSPKTSRAISSPGEQRKQGFLHICHERSSSNHKKPLSRFSSSVETIVSPPVLKQVKNRALHEKYIDQLHTREAKRKAALRNSKKFFSEKEDIKDGNAARTDNLRAAKNALISDARAAINQLQNLHVNAMSNSPNFDSDDYCDDFDDENEDNT